MTNNETLTRLCINCFTHVTYPSAERMAEAQSRHRGFCSDTCKMVHKQHNDELGRLADEQYDYPPTRRVRRTMFNYD